MMFPPFATLIAIAAGQLDSAHVSIELDAKSAMVEARYHIAESADPIRFVLIKLNAQHLRMSIISGAEATVSLDTLPGLYAFTLAPSDWRETVVSVRYEVTGDLARIPLFIPSTPTEPGFGGVRILIRGVGSYAVLNDAFPRLVRATDGSVTARPENLPSFVRLPPNRGSWTTNRVADVSVALLVLFATVSWVLRRRVLVIRRSAAWE